MSRVPPRLALAVGLLALAMHAHAQAPTAERPTYALGDTWALSDQVYELTRVEKDGYVFTAGASRIVLSRDLALARVERGGRVLLDFDPPPRIAWPLQFLARKAGRDDMVLIYFAGHGAPEVDAAGVESDGLSKYLIPSDADPDALFSTAFPMDDIQRVFARIAAERVVLILDTCYSGTAGGRTFARAGTRALGVNDQFLERLARSKGRVIVTASGPNEVALESAELGHGLFTYHVLQGLEGKADLNRDGVVTVSELYEYVEVQVERAARAAGGRQRPIMKGEVAGALPLTRTRP